MRRSLSDLDPVEYRELRELVAFGKMPRLIVLARFVQAGFLEPGTFQVRAGIKELIAANEREKKRVHVLTPTQTEAALKARKEPVIL